MPLPVIANTFRCTFEWTGTESDEQVVSVQHFNGVGTAAALATALDANVQTHQFEGMSNNVECVSVDILPLDGTSGTASFPLVNWLGSSGTGDKVPGMNILVLGSTGLRGSANRGRIFLPSVLESVITNGLLDSANRGEIEDAWNDFIVAMAGDGFDWGVASYINVTFNAYITATVPRMLGVIRRRRNVS